MKKNLNVTVMLTLAIICLSLLGYSVGSYAANEPQNATFLSFPANSGQEFLKAYAIKNDTPAIQKMIDNTPTGGTLTIPPGVYDIKKNPELVVYTDYGKSYSALKITKPITIIMDGVVFKTKTKNAHGVFWIYKASNVHLKGGTLLGDTLPTNGLFSSRIAVLVQESTDCSIDNITTKNFTQGINLYNSKNCKVKNVTVENNKASGIISIRSKNSLIDSCIIRNSGDGHLSLYGGGEYNIVKNCTISEIGQIKKTSKASH